MKVTFSELMRFSREILPDNTSKFFSDHKSLLTGKSANSFFKTVFDFKKLI